jgi:hypothetical protein
VFRYVVLYVRTPDEQRLLLVFDLQTLEDGRANCSVFDESQGSKEELAAFLANRYEGLPPSLGAIQITPREYQRLLSTGP